jgi:hypothetical protein
LSATGVRGIPSLLGALLVLLLAAAVPGSAVADETLPVNRIEWVAGSRAKFPPADALWQSHALPMRWSSSSGSRQGAWLRYRFPLSAIPADGWSMLLNRLPTGGAIYVNGRMVADLPLDSERRA